MSDVGLETLCFRSGGAIVGGRTSSVTTGDCSVLDDGEKVRNKLFSYLPFGRYGNSHRHVGCGFHLFLRYLHSAMLTSPSPSAFSRRSARAQHVMNGWPTAPALGRHPPVCQKAATLFDFVARARHQSPGAAVPPPV